MNADGTGVTRLTYNIESNFEERGFFRPAWSPSGDRIAFSSLESKGVTHNIMVMNADGSNITKLTNGPIASIVVNPTWSPNGGKIAFWAHTAGVSTDIYVMNADGSGETRLTNNSVWDESPAWSPVVR